WRIEEIQWQAPRAKGLSLFAHCLKSVGTLSVKVVAALSLFVPVAVTLYCAIRLGETLKVVVNAPFESDFTSLLMLHVLPTSSLTKMWMASFGSHPAPITVTVPPGE